MDHHYWVLNPWEYPPHQPHDSYEQPPPSTGPFHPYGEGTSSGGARHLFDYQGGRTSSGGAHQEFEHRRRSDATGFHYTPQYHEEHMAHHQRTDNTLHTLQQGQARHDQMWEEQRQWNYNTTQTLTSIRESQEQEAKEFEPLLGFFPLN
jgi:hypothetical protein